MRKKSQTTGQNAPQAVKMSQGLKRGSLLVIDDDIGMQSLLSDVLCSLGHEVTSFSDAIGALKLITHSNQKIDAIICDLNMPKISGLDFLDMLKKMNSHIPLILVTAFGTSRTADQAKAKGAFAYLSKPFQLSEISDLIQKAIESSAS